MKVKYTSMRGVPPTYEFQVFKKDEVNRLWEQGAKHSFHRRSELEAELKALEGKGDSASKERFAELIDELITVDMGLGPFRRAMGGVLASQTRDNKE